MGEASTIRGSISLFRTEGALLFVKIIIYKLSCHHCADAPVLGGSAWLVGILQ